MSKLYIHPFPLIKVENQTYMANRVGNDSNQMHYSIKEMDRQTTIYKNPEIMNDIEQYPHEIKMDHNEIARKLLDKVS